MPESRTEKARVKQRKVDLEIAKDYNEGVLTVKAIAKKYGYKQRKSIYRRIERVRDRIKAGEYDEVLGSPKPRRNKITELGPSVGDSELIIQDAEPVLVN